MITYFIFLLALQSCLIITSHSESVIRRLPGYPGDLPFKLETGYIGVGENEGVQLFYYLVESMRNPKEDPLIFYIPGGPGASAFITFMHEIVHAEPYMRHSVAGVVSGPLITFSSVEKVGPLSFNLDDGLDNLTLTFNPNTWTQMANIIIVDIPAGTGFSYSETEEGWISSDSILVIQAVDFIKKFMSDRPKYLRNPLYIAGISYMGIIVPKITLELYEGNERGDQPAFNIQGYMLISPLTNKFMDFNSRLEYAHRMALISDNIYQSALNSCRGNYVDINSANPVCLNSLQGYEECTSHINVENILEPFCDCESDISKISNKWVNIEVVQQALNVRQGKVGEWKLFNTTLHYHQGKNDTFCYSYDIFSSFSYHKKLSSKNCRALIMSGDHDLTFPYVGVEQWINSLNLQVEVQWKPFYIDGQVGGYKTKYAQDDYSLTFATIKGAGHTIPHDKPRQIMVLTQEWFSSQTYSGDS